MVGDHHVAGLAIEFESEPARGTTFVVWLPGVPPELRMAGLTDELGRVGVLG